MATIQGVYLALFGRPADPAGLAYFNTITQNGADLTAIGDLSATAEYQDRFEGMNNSQIVTSIYQSLFNRNPELAGLNFFVAALNNGTLNINNIAIAILDGAQGDDLLTVNNKLAAADAFTAAVAADPELLAAYVGDDAAAIGRDFLDDITADPATIPNAEMLQGFLNQLEDLGTMGQTFVLTESADIIPGLIGSNGDTNTDGNDLILSGNVVAGGPNTLGAADSLNGGEGFDTLRMLDDAGGALVPNTQNIERFELQSTAGGTTTVNMVNAMGVNQTWNYRSTGNVEYNNVQNEVTVGVFDSNTRNEVTFEDGVDFGGDLQLVVDRAGVEGNFATIRVNTDADIDTLRVGSFGGPDTTNFLEIDVDDAPGAGVPAAPTSLFIDGDAGLVLREENGQGETDFLTSIDSTGLSGSLDLDLSDNDEDFVFVGGDGDTTIDASGNGDVDITTGAGDDYINLDDEATAADTVDGGDGTDTIGIDDDIIEALTSDGDFEAGISNIEQVRITGVINDGQDVTVDLDNLDDIDYVISEGTNAGDPSFDETQVFTVNSGADGTGGEVIVGGVRIPVANGASADDIADAIAAAEADIIAANPTVTDVFTNGFNQVTVIYDSAAGDVGPIAISSSNGSGVTFGGVASADGTDLVTEQQTIALPGAPTATGFVTIDGIAIQVFLGETEAQTAARIATALDTANSTYSAAVSGNDVVVTFATGGEKTELVVSGDGAVFGAAVTVTETRADVAAAGESQTVAVISGTDATGGEIVVGGVRITLDADLTNDEVGAAIVAANAAIQAANPDIIGVAYDSGTNNLTFTYATAAGNVAPIVVGDNPTGATFSAVGTLVTGDAGTPGGILTLEYVADGGTLELDGDNDGTTVVVIGGASIPTDTEFNIVLTDAANHDGVIVLDDVETLNVVAEADGAAGDLGIASDSLVTINVTGTGGVDFGDPDLASLETVNATDLDVANDEEGVSIETDNVDGTTFNGSAGEDSFIGDDGDDVMNGGAGDDFLDGNMGDDTIEGGDGDDFIDGGLGADTLTGGAGEDTFFFNNVADSQGVTVDTITDFTTGEDTLDFSGIVFGFAGSYEGEANGYGAVLTSLAAGESRAVLDISTSTLYVDVNGDGALDNNDMAIDLTGVTDLAATDFVF